MTAPERTADDARFRPQVGDTYTNSVDTFKVVAVENRGVVVSDGYECHFWYLDVWSTPCVGGGTWTPAPEVPAKRTAEDARYAPIVGDKCVFECGIVWEATEVDDTCVHYTRTAPNNIPWATSIGRRGWEVEVAGVTWEPAPTPAPTDAATPPRSPPRPRRRTPPRPRPPCGLSPPRTSRPPSATRGAWWPMGGGTRRATSSWRTPSPTRSPGRTARSTGGGLSCGWCAWSTV